VREVSQRREIQKSGAKGKADARFEKVDQSNLAGKRAVEKREAQGRAISVRRFSQATKKSRGKGKKKGISLRGRNEL